MMIKVRDESGTVAVTFSLPVAVGAGRAAICGEWNDWSPDQDVMEQVEEGFIRTIPLEGGRSYLFRYLLDGVRWENDWAADRYVSNGCGGDNSVVDLTDLPDGIVPAAVVSLDSPAPRPEESLGQTEALATAAASSVEREAKLLAPPGLGLPNLDELTPGTRAITRPVRRLDAIYYDTADLRLARSGITVRHRGGEPGPAWTVKLPDGGSASDLVRREIRFEGGPDRVPDPAAELVLASTRTLDLQRVAQLTTVRRPIEIRDGSGQLLAEVVDDTVSVSQEVGQIGRFREIEVELHVNGADGQRVLDAALSRLIGAGCDAGTPTPKLVRALGEPATRAPDVVVSPLPEKATVIDLVRQSTARSVEQIIRHDPGARLGGDDEEVHKMRVATRRLRSDLHSFSSLLDETRTDPLRAELSWLGGMIGAVRDTDVLTLRLTSRLASLADGEVAEADRLLSLLAEESAAARVAMMSALRDKRYLRLLNALVALAAAPPFLESRKISRRKSRRVASKIMHKPWRRVVDAVGALGDDPSDEKLHHVRVLAKRSRYAAEATAPLLGPDAARFASAVADLQTVLGDHQDTVLAEEWLLRAASEAPEVADVVAQLIAVERARRGDLRVQWPAVWQRAVGRELP
jgi:CHAD domain-containing protein